MNQADVELYREHSGALLHFATGLVGPFDAPDVVAEASLKAFSSNRWAEIKDRRAYLYRCVLNTARSHHRSTMARRIREQRASVPLGVSQQQRDLDVLAALDRLSIRQRAVVLLTYWDDLAISDVARTLGISDGSVRRHLARARSRLREVLK